MTFPTILLTTAGVRAILRALTDGEIQFSKIKLGDGTAPADIRTMTDIVSPKYTCGITGITISDGFATLECSFDNSNVSTGFYARELGVFMTDENGNDVLYGYTNAGSECGYVKPFNQATYVHTNFHVTVAVGDAEDVTAIIAPDVGYVSDEEFAVLSDAFDAHLEATNPHNITKATIGLGNVVNSAPSDMQITFSTAADLNTMTTGATVSTIAGKVNKILSEMGDPSNEQITFTTASTSALMTSPATLSEIAGKVNKALSDLANTPSVSPSEMTITFTEASTLTKPASGSTLATISGAVAKSIDVLSDHIGNTNNPHSVTYSQVGAAAASHTHTVSQITDMTLEVATVSETENYLGISSS